MNDLMTETMDLAKSADLPVADICQAAAIKPRWYYRFLAGDFKDPGINKIMRLHKVLSDQKRKAAA